MQVKVMNHNALASVPALMPSKPASVRAESQPITASSAVPATDIPTTNSVSKETSNAVEAEGFNDLCSSLIDSLSVYSEDFLILYMQLF